MKAKSSDRQERLAHPAYERKIRVAITARVAQRRERGGRLGIEDRLRRTGT